MDSIEINGKKLTCLFCGNDNFDKVKTLMNRRFSAIFDWEVFSLMGKKSLGTTYVCKACGYSHEFFKDLPKDREERLQELNPLN